MIKQDQPTIFGDQVTAAVSSANDGDMSFASTTKNKVITNRLNFFEQLGIKVDDVTALSVNLDETDDFTRYKIINSDFKGDRVLTPEGTLSKDAIVVLEPNHAIFLTLGDCCGAIIFAPDKHVLMLSHLGRHSLEANGGAESVEFLKKQFKVDTSQLLVWLSPAAGQKNYPLYRFDGDSLHKVATQQLVSAGVNIDNIEICLRDTTTDDNYFSHSQYLAGKTKVDSRHAIIAMMR